MSAALSCWHWVVAGGEGGSDVVSQHIPWQCPVAQRALDRWNFAAGYAVPVGTVAGGGGGVALAGLSFRVVALCGDAPGQSLVSDGIRRQGGIWCQDGNARTPHFRNHQIFSN